MLLLALLACDPTDSPGVDTADSAGGDTADTGEAAPEVVHYFGESQGQTPDGSYVADPEAILFIRTLDAGASTITEEVWVEGSPKWVHYLLVHIVDAEAGTFTSEWASEEGTIDVVGGYDAGAAWAWTAWHSTSTYRDGKYAGTVVTSEDAVSDEGVAQAHKAIFDAEGTETWNIVETLTPTSEEEFAAALDEIKWE